MLKEYHETLQKHGVTGYSLEECREDFEKAKLFALVVTFPITRCTMLKPFYYDPEVKEIEQKYRMVKSLLNKK